MGWVLYGVLWVLTGYSGYSRGVPVGDAEHSAGEDAEAIERATELHTPWGTLVPTLFSLAVLRVLTSRVRLGTHTGRQSKLR